MKRIGGGMVVLLLVSSSAWAANFVPNSGFEACVAASAPDQWTAVAGEGLACDATAPEEGSFALALSNAVASMLSSAQSACVVVPPNTPIDDFSFAYRTSSVSVYQVALTVNFFATSDCSGTSSSDSTGVGVNSPQTLTKDGNWHVLTSQQAMIDPTTNSIRFTASFQAQAAQLTSTVDFDALSFTANAVTTTTTQASGSSTTTTTAGAGTTTTTTPPVFPGTGNPASECFVATEGLAPTADGRVVCADGDPTCDADGAANGACTFRFRVCVAEVEAGCQVSSITAVKAKPASLGVALPAVPASSPTCGADTDLVVPLVHHGRGVGRRTLTLTADNSGKPKHERDRLRFECHPSA
jgi:hypothetical protein